MNTDTFFRETSPLIPALDQRFCCNPQNHEQNYKYKKIALVVCGILFIAIVVSNINDGVKTIVARPLKTKDAIFAGVEIGASALCFIFSCIFAGCYIGKYQNLVESYPQGSYQGSFNNYFEIYPRHQSVIDTGKHYIPEFINQFEPALLDAYFMIKKIESNENKIEYLGKKLEGGCCFGYSMALLAKMKNHANTSSKKLLSSLKVENIIYYQLTNSILWTLLNNTESFYYPAYYFLYREATEEEKKIYSSFSDFLNFGVENTLELRRKIKKNPDAISNNDALKINEKMDISNNDVTDVDKELPKAETITSPYKKFFEHKQLFFNYCGFSSEGICIQAMNELEIDNIEKIDLSNYFKKAQEGISQQATASNIHNELTLAGYIYLKWTKNEKEKGSAHAIFFQMSDEHFRFYDSASPLNHFFEFTSKELMTTGILNHMKLHWDSFEKASLELVLVGIPHQKPDTLL